MIDEGKSMNQLHNNKRGQCMNTGEINQARVFIYNILSMLFVEHHVKHNAQMIIENINVLCNNAFDEEVEASLKQILNHIDQEGLQSLYANYQEIFLVPFGTYVSLSSSQYHEQREAGTMLVRVRSILAKTKIRRDENLFKAPEDHYGFLFTFSAYLIEQQQSGGLCQDLQKELFAQIINPYVDSLLAQLQSSNNPIYNPVAVFLSNFIQFERAYLKINRNI